MNGGNKGEGERERGREGEQMLRTWLKGGRCIECSTDLYVRLSSTTSIRSNVFPPNLSTGHEGDLVSVVEELEGMNPTPDPATSELFNGKWALLYAATLQRSGQSVGGDGALQAFLDTSYDSVRKVK